MMDVRDESVTHPKPLPLGAYRQILVLAAHPDDEVYGCGGLIALARRAGLAVCARVLTGGGKGGSDEHLVERRRQESRDAARILGHALEFGEHTDRGLRLSQTLIQDLAECLDRLSPDLVLAPSLNDPHPDHQALALAAMRVLSVPPCRADLAFYDTNGGLATVTHLLDTSAVVEAKRSAMACFASQEAEFPYARRIEARDCFRAFPLGKALAAEAFHLARLRERGFEGLLPALDPLFRHGAVRAAAHDRDAPLVSVLIRTIGDPALEEAVASALAQTYRPLEIVLVSATGADLAGQFPQLFASGLVRQVAPGPVLTRPQAANRALREARGQYLTFLDDDDLILPDHVEKLVAALRASPQALAANTDVRVTGEGGVTLRAYAYEVDFARLLGSNLLPIHSVLFDRRLVETQDCQFDEELPRLEDWDFWLQVAQKTSFVKVAGVSAVYRYRDRTGLLTGETPGQAPKSARDLRAAILAKWRARVGATMMDTALAVHAAALDESERRRDHAEHRVSALSAALERLQAEYGTQQAGVSRVAALEQELEFTRAELRSILRSSSWRLTAPLRALFRGARKRVP